MLSARSPETALESAPILLALSLAPEAYSCDPPASPPPSHNPHLHPSSLAAVLQRSIGLSSCVCWENGGQPSRGWIERLSRSILGNADRSPALLNNGSKLHQNSPFRKFCIIIRLRLIQTNLIEHYNTWFYNEYGRLNDMMLTAKLSLDANAYNSQ